MKKKKEPTKVTMGRVVAFSRYLSSSYGVETRFVQLSNAYAIVVVIKGYRNIPNLRNVCLGYQDGWLATCRIIGNPIQALIIIDKNEESK